MIQSESIDKMAEMYIDTTIWGSVPGSFQQVAHDKLSESASKRIPVLAILLLLLSASVFLVLSLTIGKLDHSFTQGGFKIGKCLIEKDVVIKNKEDAGSDESKP